MSLMSPWLSIHIFFKYIILVYICIHISVAVGADDDETYIGMHIFGHFIPSCKCMYMKSKLNEIILMFIYIYRYNKEYELKNLQATSYWQLKKIKMHLYYSLWIHLIMKYYICTQNIN